MGQAMTSSFVVKEIADRHVPPGKASVPPSWVEDQSSCPPHFVKLRIESSRPVVMEAVERHRATGNQIWIPVGTLGLKRGACCDLLEAASVSEMAYLRYRGMHMPHGRLDLAGFVVVTTGALLLLGIEIGKIHAFFEIPNTIYVLVSVIGFAATAFGICLQASRRILLRNLG